MVRQIPGLALTVALFGCGDDQVHRWDETGAPDEVAVHPGGAPGAPGAPGDPVAGGPNPEASQPGEDGRVDADDPSGAVDEAADHAERPGAGDDPTRPSALDEFEPVEVGFCPHVERPAMVEAPRMPYDALPVSFDTKLGEQTAWVHDEGHTAGVYYTFDDLVLCGESPRKVHVLVPRDVVDGAIFPAIYFNDGNTTFWGNGLSGQSWSVAESLSALYAEGLPRSVVVAVHPLPGLRDWEYTHAEGAGVEGGGLPEYTDYIADCLKPFVDEHFPTRIAPNDTLIVGASRGGLAAFWMATRRPDAFGVVAALSPSFWAGLDDLEADAKGPPLADSPLIEPVAELLSDAERRPRMWLDWGLERQGGEHNAIIEAAATERGQEMVATLRDCGYSAERLTACVDPDGGHDERSWGRRWPDVYRWFMER